MLGYAMVGSNNLGEAKTFYEELFTCVGFSRLVDLKWGGACWGPEGWGCGSPTTMFCVVSPYDEEIATFGNGAMIALVLKSPEDVDRMYATAMKLGGTDEGEPALREINVPGFYGAYFRDLDHNKLAAYHIIPSDSPLRSSLKKLY